MSRCVFEKLESVPKNKCCVEMADAAVLGVRNQVHFVDEID